MTPEAVATEEMNRDELQELEAYYSHFADIRGCNPQVNGLPPCTNQRAMRAFGDGSRQHGGDMARIMCPVQGNRQKGEGGRVEMVGYNEPSGVCFGSEYTQIRQRRSAETRIPGNCDVPCALLCCPMYTAWYLTFDLCSCCSILPCSVQPVSEKFVATFPSLVIHADQCVLQQLRRQKGKVPHVSPTATSIAEQADEGPV
jgi:hypothetical protein